MTTHVDVWSCHNPDHTNPLFTCPECEVRCPVCGPGECPVLEREALDQLQKENAS